MQMIPSKRWIDDPQVRLILKYVLWFRQVNGIVTTRGIKPEFSCEGHGEFRNLLYRQLVTTDEFTDGWLELRQSDEEAHAIIRDGVIRQIESDIEGYLNDVSLRSHDLEELRLIACLFTS